jgi:non-ribosomal peptide synthetase component F
MDISEVEYSGPVSIYQKRFAGLTTQVAVPAVLNVSLRLDITGPLDSGALARAASALVARHHALRTGFHRHGDHFVQQVSSARPAELPVTVLDSEHLPPAERRDVIERWCEQQASTLFDLDGDSLIRFTLARVSAEAWVLMIVQHHIITDATSTSVLLSDLAALYRAEVEGRDAALTPPSAQQIDFARWQHERLTEDYKSKLIEFWRGELDGAAFTLPLPGERPRPPKRSGEGGLDAVYVPLELGEQLADCARQHGVTLFALLTAAFGTLLCGLTCQDEVVLITPFQNRMGGQFETVVGQLANSVPLRLRSNPAENIADLIKRTGRQLWVLADHQELPLPVILESLQLAQRPGAAEFPLGFFALHPRAGERLDLPGLRVTATDFAIPAARLDFGVLVVPTEHGLKLWAEYGSHLGAETVRGWLDRYVELLARFASSPESPVGRLFP